VSPLAVSIKRTMLFLVHPVKGVSAFLIKTRPSHEVVGPAHLRAITNMVNTTLPCTKMDQANFANAAIDILAKHVLSIVLSSQVDSMRLFRIGSLAAVWTINGGSKDLQHFRVCPVGDYVSERTFTTFSHFAEKGTRVRTNTVDPIAEASIVGQTKIIKLRQPFEIVIDSSNPAFGYASLGMALDRVKQPTRLFQTNATQNGHASISKHCLGAHKAMFEDDIIIIENSTNVNEVNTHNDGPSYRGHQAARRMIRLHPLSYIV
jgi:hypothetical protein